MSTPDKPTSQTPSNPELIAAWQWFINYDESSKRHKRKRIRIRTAIIWISFASSVLAVVLSVFFPNPEAIPDQANRIRNGLLIALAVLPGVSTVLVGYALRFSPMSAWAVYRVGAELIRREIYLYRTHAGPYTDLKGKDDEKRRILLENLKKASRVEKIYATDRMQENPTIKQTVQDVLLGAEATPSLREIKTPEKVRQQIEAQTKKYSNQRDDGFGDLTVEEYVEHRLVGQLDWYTKRVGNDFFWLQFWQVAILMMGALGTVLVALSTIVPYGSALPPFVAVTTAFAAAFGLYLELQMFNHTYPIYSTAARRLKNLMDEWQIRLSYFDAANDIHQKLRLQFIVEAESVLQSEREEWMIRVVQTQSALEQKLSRSDKDDINQEYHVQQSGLGTSLLNLAGVELGGLKNKQALALYQEALRVFNDSKNTLGTLEAVEGIIESLVLHPTSNRSDDPKSRQHLENTAMLYGAVTKWREQRNQAIVPAQKALFERAMRPLREQLDGQFSSLQTQGQALDFDEMVKLASEQSL